MENEDQQNRRPLKTGLYKMEAIHITY